jgi:hypothetical protein
VGAGDGNGGGEGDVPVMVAKTWAGGLNCS